jgi:ribosome production factor 1
MSEDDFSGSLGSDFGEMEDEYECDSDGNPINAPKIGKGNISIKTLKA